MYDTVIYLPENFEPNLVFINLYCDGYDQPFLVMKLMRRHSSPVAGGSYLFPGKAKDMKPGEYWNTASLHSTSSYGSQLFAYDMGVRGWDGTKNGYSDLLPGTDGCKNSDYRVYGKPVYAMADGTVARFRDDVAENPMPWRLVGDTKRTCPTEAEKKAFDCGTLPKDTGAGNFFSIQSGDEMSGYAHLQAGSLNPNLTRKGARVRAGDFLGLVGNAGCSTAPHIHFDVVQIHNRAQIEIDPLNNHPSVLSLRPLIFHDIYTIDFSLLTGRDPKPEKWSKVNDQAIPAVGSAIWASPKVPCFYPPERVEVAFHGVAETDFQTAFDRATGCGYYPVWVDGFEFNDKNYYNAIFRYGANFEWVSYLKLSRSEFNNERANLEGKGFRLVFIDSYQQNAKDFYSCIFFKDGGAQTKVTVALTANQHENKLDEMKTAGWKPIQVSGVSSAGLRHITTLYEKRAVGKWVIKSHLTAQEYNELFDENWKNGMELVHLNVYREFGITPYYAAIWHEVTSYKALSAKHKLSASDYQLQYDDHRNKGFLTRVVTGYELNNKMTFEGVWTD